MQWVTLTHTQRWHIKMEPLIRGIFDQIRYKSFLIEGGKHCLFVIRYVECNTLRFRIVRKSEDCDFCSLSRRLPKW